MLPIVSFQKEERQDNSKMGRGGIQRRQRISLTYDLRSTYSSESQSVHRQSDQLLGKDEVREKKNPQNKVIEVCYPSEKTESKFTKETGDFSLGFGGYTTKQFKRITDIVDTDNSYWI